MTTISDPLVFKTHGYDRRERSLLCLFLLCSFINYKKCFFFKLILTSPRILDRGRELHTEMFVFLLTTGNYFLAQPDTNEESAADSNSDKI